MVIIVICIDVPFIIENRLSAYDVLPSENRYLVNATNVTYDVREKSIPHTLAIFNLNYKKRLLLRCIHFILKFLI